MRTRNAGIPKAAPVKKTPPSRKSATKTPPNPHPETPETPSVSASTAGQPVEQENILDDAVEVTPQTKVTRGGRRSSTRKAPARTKTPTSARAASRKASKSEVIENLKVEESPEKEEGGDHRDGESAEKEETSKTIAEESLGKKEPVIENVEETEKEGDQTALDVAEPPKVEENTSDMEQSMVLDMGISSGQQEDNIDTNQEEKTFNTEQEEETIVIEEEEKTIDTEETSNQNDMIVEETPKMEEKTIDKGHNLDQSVMSLEEPLEVEEKTIDTKQPPVPTDGEATSQADLVAGDVAESLESQEPGIAREEEEAKEEMDEEMMIVEDKVGPQNEPVNMPEDVNKALNGGDAQADMSQEDLVAGDGVKSLRSQEPGIARGEEEVKEELEEELRIVEDKAGPVNEPVNMEEDVDKAPKGEDAQAGNESQNKERLEESGSQEILEEPKEEKLADDDVQEHDDASEALDEHAELTAAAKERKIKKELEVFVGGLDRDGTEEDVKKAFENIGDVVEVRLLKDLVSNKNKGFAFVKFATKEQASRALSEMKNPLIRGKRCRTAPSEDNDMLFLGNICNTWTKDAIKRKLKDYGIEGVEKITVVPDARHDGRSRGFAFLEFPCHADAMLAYKRLQKPDVIFGHTERTAKVAFAEPIREPDPEVMAQVKSVFVDGLSPQWDESRVREKLKGYGEIVRVMLARNMSTAKRRDYGFVDFTTHEAAVACVDGINSKDFGDGKSKSKVRARLSNPLPKTQAVKGGMCGGFRIGRGSAGSSSKSGRGIGWGGHAFNRQNVQSGRGFYQRGRGQGGRIGFTREHDLNMQYPPFQRREMFGRGAWRDPFGAAHDTFTGGAAPTRPNLDMIRHDAPDRGRGRHVPSSRLPFPPEEGFSRPVPGRHFDDPYFYDNGAHGMKRPFAMMDQDPDYMEPSRFRPRLDYSDPAVPYRAPHYRDSLGAGSSLHSHDYYGPNYGEAPHSSFYGNDRPYGGGYYY